MADNIPLIADDERWMRLALEQAARADSANEVPVGAVLVANNALIASAYNHPLSGCDPTAHAEIAVLRKAAHILQNYRLANTTLYVTVEPCTMCFGAIMHSRVQGLVYGASEPKAGVVESQLQLAEQAFYNHQIEVTAGVLAEQCSAMMSAFFRRRRLQKKAQK